MPKAPPAPLAPTAPKHLVTVVHRLSGWKLLTWLAINGPPMLELERFPSAADVHTNIVAGFVSADGRTVVARLPRAEALLETATRLPPPPDYFTDDEQQPPSPSEFVLILGDGRRIDAKFVGLDASTGLSLLEASEPLLAVSLTGDEGNTEDPTVGQLVRLFAPAPLDAHDPTARDMGVVYFVIDQTEGRLTAVNRASTGKPFQVTARASGVTPAWTGAVAMDEAGALVGIVAESGASETQIVPAGTMRGAIERVLAQRTSVPQPWLGVRGDDVNKFLLEQWVNIGWKPETALPLIQNRQGVLLTSVAPGTPAATAGLRPGDVISRIGGREVRGVEDLAPLLREAGVGQTVDFTVLRALEQAPLRLPVMLSGTQSPAIATAEAELKAARTSVQSLEVQLHSASLEARRLQREPVPEAEAQLRMEARLKEVEDRLREVRTEAAVAESRVAEARRRVREPTRPMSVGAGRGGSLRPFQPFGLEVLGLTPRSASRLSARSGLLVVSVVTDSPAAACGLRVGDVIETINGQSFKRLEIRGKLRDVSIAPLPLGVVREGHRLSLTLSMKALVQP